jgi:F420-non-reducing hydrogenase iron-sulfur subunit
MNALSACSAEAPRFAEVVTRFTEKLRGLGPNPLQIRKAANA